MLEAVGETPVLAVIWVHGEADARTEAAASEYGQFLLRLVMAIRRDLDVPTVITLLPTRKAGYRHFVRYSQLRLIRAHPSAVLGADPDTLFVTYRDRIHYSESSMRDLAGAEAEVVRGLGAEEGPRLP